MIVDATPIARAVPHIFSPRPFVVKSPAKQALKKALIDYQGTLLLVTHDRDFASAIGTRILAITHKKVIDFRGSYDDYLAKLGQDYFKK